MFLLKIIYFFILFKKEKIKIKNKLNNSLLN
jgi:hypothetical protein